MRRWPAVPVDPLASLARAQRAMEHIQLFRMVHGSDAEGKWLAISLADGSCDQKPYASKREAVRFQLHETQCAYLCLTGMPTLGELRMYLDTNEELYDAGMSLADPDTYVNPEAML
jgi:hypothetical protein